MPKPNEFKVPEPITDEWYRRMYLTGNHWRWRRENYIKQVGFYCEANWNGSRCRSLGTQVHHLKYDNLYRERDEDLQLLCRPCHEKMHKWPKAANDNGQLTFLFDRLDQKKKSGN